MLQVTAGLVPSGPVSCASPSAASAPRTFPAPTSLRSWRAGGAGMLCGGGTHEDNAGNIRYYLVLKAERSALKEAWCLLNISAGSRD